MEEELNLSSKMHDCVDVVLSEEMADQVCALNVSFDQLRSRPIPCHSCRGCRKASTTVGTCKQMVSV